MCHSRTVVCLRAVLVLVLIGAASSLSALANRVFVSARSGNDANNCANVATPCQTFAGAVLQLNPGGEAIVLDSGGYGPVTITKALTIEAAPGVTAFIHASSGDAVMINAGSGDKVVLRGLVLNGGPDDGIRASTVGTLYIENCVVSGFAAFGIQVNAVGSKTFVKDTIVRQNTLTGIIFFAGRGSVDHCRIEGNGTSGVQVSAAHVTIRDSVSAGNGAHGFIVTASGVEETVLNVYQCMATNNDQDGLVAFNAEAGATIARVANSSMSDNFGIGLNNDGGGGSVIFESLGNNLVRGNFFGDTAGTITVVAPK